MEKNFIPFDWNSADREAWLEPCEESYYYAAKWKREGIKSVLDLGCGLGRHSVLFAQCGFKVTALDISDDALSFLKKYSKEMGVDIACRRADMESLPFADDAFDCIFAMHSAGHTDTEGMRRIMAELRRVLKPDGELFMTLCSKETWTFLQPELPRLDENTVVKTDGPEQGVPHFFADRENIESLFRNFELRKVRHTDDCFDGEKWRNMKHYFIEARISKAPSKPDYTEILGKEFTCKVDRPLGSAHPRNPAMIYPVNYGYIEGITAGDGAWQDVYILGISQPVKEFTGKVIAVYHRLNDNEDKWIIAPEGARFTPEDITEQIAFQERFFDGELYLK